MEYTPSYESQKWVRFHTRVLPSCKHNIEVFETISIDMSNEYLHKYLIVHMLMHSSKR
jgi:hypothetical protein